MEDERTIKTLRPYQRSITGSVLRSDKDQIVALPTGAGKTVIANAIMNELPGTKIFIVPRLELIAQAKKEFGDVDVVWADRTELTGRKTIIASKDSLRSQMDKIELQEEEPLTLVYDEAHIGIRQTHGLTEAFRKKHAKLRVLGLTATPERMDGLALLKGSRTVNKYGVFDEVLQEETVASLIDKHYLAPLKYYAKPIEGITSIRPDSSKGEELSAQQMMKIMEENGIWGDLVGCYEKYGLNRPAVGFTVTVAMAEAVAQLFTDAGYDFRVIHGEMKVSERKELIDMLTEHEIDGLVNASLLTYGFDCPPASYAFSVRHIKSRPLWFQMVGRILRPYPGKMNAVFVDHGDSISEFSEPNDPLPILSPVMNWRANGEDKDQKLERKRQTRKVQETMKLIQELAPLPADMVEVTTEDTYTRLIRVIQRLQAENGSLRKLVEKSQSEKAELEKEKQAAVDAAEKYAMTAAEKEKELAMATKTIDKDATFEYVRSNYCRIRRSFSYKYKDAASQHAATVSTILQSEPKLNFYFDKTTLTRSLDYWKNNYHDEYKPAGA